MTYKVEIYNFGDRYCCSRKLSRFFFKLPLKTKILLQKLIMDIHEWNVFIIKPTYNVCNTYNLTLNTYLIFIRNMRSIIDFTTLVYLLIKLFLLETVMLLVLKLTYIK